MAFLFVVHLCYISKRTMLQTHRHRETFWTNPLSQIYGKVFGFGLSELTKIIQMAPYLGLWYTITYRKEVQGSHRLYIETNRLYNVHRATYPYDDEIGFGHFIYYIEMLSFALFAISNLFEISLRWTVLSPSIWQEQQQWRWWHINVNTEHVIFRYEHWTI